MSRLQVPNQLNVGAQRINTIDAFPSAGTLVSSQGAQTMIYGGLTKLEWMAGMVASGVKKVPWTPEEIVDEWMAGMVASGVKKVPWTPEEIVDIAQDILAECERRQNATQKQNGESQT